MNEHPGTVAKIIIDLIQKQIDEIMSRENPPLREKIIVNVVVGKVRLRELSGRSHIRRQFKEEVVRFINNSTSIFEGLIDQFGDIQIIDKVLPNVVKIISMK